MKILTIAIISFFLTFLFSNTPFLEQYASADYPPPLQQVRHGIPSSQVKCNEGFVNIFKIAGGSPACVKLAIAVSLVDRGSWLTNVQTAWFSYEPSETIPWLGNLPSDISTNHTEQCAMANSTWEYLKSQGIVPFEILWTYPNLVATPEGVAGQQPTAGFLVHVLPNESSIMDKLDFKKRSDVYYPLDLSLTPRLSICNDSSGEIQSLVNSGSGKHPLHTNSIRDTSFIKLLLTTNSTIIRQGQVIGLDVLLNNTSPNTLILNSENDWPMEGLNMGPCELDPVGIGIYEGNYSLENIPKANPLQLYQNGTYMCQMLVNVNRYIFEPSSDQVISETDNGNSTREMKYSTSFHGFYTRDGFVQPPIGTYTVIADDQWGHLAIQHFTVTNSTR